MKCKRNTHTAKRLSALALLTSFVIWVFVVPLTLYFQLESESVVATSSINLSSNPEVMEVKIALALPYGSDWSEAQDSRGLMEFNGEFYTLMSRDYRNDTLYFRYLKNNNAREIFGMLSDHVDQGKQDRQNSDKTDSGIGKWLGMKYLLKTSALDLASNKAENVITPSHIYHNFYHFDFSDITGPPPRCS